MPVEECRQPVAGLQDGGERDIPAPAQAAPAAASTPPAPKPAAPAAAAAPQSPAAAPAPPAAKSASPAAPVVSQAAPKPPRVQKPAAVAPPPPPPPPTVTTAATPPAAAESGKLQTPFVPGSAVIAKACARYLLLHCRDVEPGSGRTVACLKDYIKAGNFVAPRCQTALKLTAPLR